MSRKLPPFVEGHYYHIYNRGARRVSIFREQENYLFVLKKLKRYRRELRHCVIAYCLMPNHYHWLVRQDGREPVRLLPQRVFNSYGKAFNKRYDHGGTLVDRAFVREYFATPEVYARFVEDYLLERRLPEEVERQIRGLIR